jgi:DNA topoisomerase-1
MSKNLLIVESPAKAKTIQGYLGQDYEVASCNGHIRDLPKNNKAIDIGNGFKPTYEINKDKQQLVKDLQKRAAKARQVYLASDDDREGEAISWHLKEVLDLDAAKTKRIVFREITQKAITQAIKSPRNIDLALVNSQQARRILDRLVGFDLSPLLWKKIKAGLSAGRVQSVAVRIIVERERAINSFQTSSFFVITAFFDLGQAAYLKAELEERFKTVEEAHSFLTACIDAEFSIQNLEKKPSKRSPAPPFITSTLQQEASYRLGYSVSKTMLLAQNLYEAGKISYMRTDSLNLSQEAVESARQEIVQAYGAAYFQARKYKNSSTAQEAHEAIRPTDFAKQIVSDNVSEQKLYELIWRRAIASQMADAKLEKTLVTIGISTIEKKLLAQGEVVKFDGFLKVYALKQEEDAPEEATILPPLTLDKVLPLAYMQAKERFNKPPARYTEASLVKQLEELGIGRPSTYAPIISTIQQRGYVIKESREGRSRAYQLLTLQKKAIKQEECLEIVGTEKNKLFPTDIAMVVNDFLVNRFTEITDYGFTAKVEQELDRIANGDKHWDKMLADFYQNFHPKIEATAQLERASVNNWRLLGEDPATGKPIIARLGKYGPLVQIGDMTTENAAEPPRFASLHPGQRLESISLEEALQLFQLPREVGNLDNDTIIANVGRFGPYLKYQGKFYSLARGEEPLAISQDRAIEIIHAKQAQDAKKLLKTFEEDPDIQILNGQYGPYIKAGKRNIKLPKEVDISQLTLAACKDFIEQAPEKKKKTNKKINK